MDKLFRHGRIWFALFVLCVTNISLAGLFDHIPTTGHDHDVIFEFDATGASVTTDVGQRWFVEVDQFFADEVNPLPLNRTVDTTNFNGMLDDVSFTFEEYTSNNVVHFNVADDLIAPGEGTISKTLNLNSPSGYGQLGIVYTAGDVGGTPANVEYTINYASGPAQVGTFLAGDWGAPPVAGSHVLGNFDRANLSGGGIGDPNAFPIFESGATDTRWSIYVATVPVNSTSNISSVDFRVTQFGDEETTTLAADDVNIFGLTGSPDFVASLSMTIDRDSGQVSLTNSSGMVNADVTGYSLTSTAGSLDANGWTTVTGNYDSSGNGSVDPNGTWSVTSSTAFDLTEVGDADGGTIDAGQTVDFGSAWLQSPFEDVQAIVTLANGVEQVVPVSFTGNGDAAFQAGDLNFSGGPLDAQDWLTYLSFDQADLTGLSQAEAYRMGDLTGDGFKNLNDMRQFMILFEAANGAGSFQQMLEDVPEPASHGALLFGFVLAIFAFRKKRIAGAAVVAVVACGILLTPQSGFAASVEWGDVFEIFTDEDIDTSFPIVSAINGGPANAADINVTIDGIDVNFVSPGTPVLQNANFGAGGIPEVGSTGNAALDEVFESHTWQGGSYPMTDAVPFTLDELISGQAYQIQLIAGVDGRGCCQDRTQVMQDTIDGTGNNSSPLARSSDLTGSGIRRANSVIGTFTADSTSQTIFISGATDPTISAYVLSQLGEVASLTIEVNTQSGLVRMLNDTDRNFTINGYEITSAGGALDPVGWNSYADQNLDPVNGGDDPGETWLEDATSSSTVLSEGYLLGGTSFGMDDSQTLGMAYSPSVFGQGNDGDLAFRFTTTEGSILNGNVVYISPTGPPCDFNGDGLCNIQDIDLMFSEGPIAFGVDVSPGNQFDLDADGDIDLADRDLWLAQAASENGLPSPYKLGDGNLDGVVDVPDFNIWNSNKFTDRILWSEGNFNGDNVVDVSDFNLWNGNKFSASDAAAVPEPAAVFGLLIGGLALLKLRRA